MEYRILPVTPFRQNCSLIWCPRTRLGALIDPGGEADRLLDAASETGVSLSAILLTHGHIDHVGAAGKIADKLGIPILGPHADDAFLLDALPEQCAMFGFPVSPAFRPDRWLGHLEKIAIGDVELLSLHCPGHTPGHIVFYQAEARTAFVGDVLFKGSIGRTDFERGNHGALIRSIRERLWPLGDDVTFVPGHGACSTFGWERRHNPFVGDAAA